jgi:hypothetical protein
MRRFLSIFCLSLALGAGLSDFGQAQAVAPLDANQIPEADYVRVTPAGHLASRGQRVRLWGVIGSFPNHAGIAAQDAPEAKAQKVARARRDSEALVRRFTELGFNMTRLWSLWDAQGDYTPGDGSASDTVDYFVWKLKEAGFRIWVPSISWVEVGPEDVSILNEPATAQAWRAAMQQGKDKRIGNLWVARVWDERMEAKQRKEMLARATRLNRYTGLRLCDDPVMAIWELTNEEWWMTRMVGGSWLELPDYFKQSLARKWNAFLVKKYGTEAKLIARWGFLLPGESLKKGTVRVLPLAGKQSLDTASMDPQARRQLEAAQAVGIPAFGRDDVSRRRGEDVLAFFLSLQLAHKQRLGAALKACGRSTKLCPLIYDTGIGYEIQSQYLHQQADAVSHDAYINGWHADKDHPRYPWYSGLEQYPRICGDVPWLEHNKVEGKPFLCYETQIQQPAKYRAEFPLRLLALASIQDWDAICWHYWGAVPDISTHPRPFDRAMDVTTGGHPQGYHYTFDEVQNAMMRAAAFAFRNQLIPPAPKPTKFIFGRRSLYDPASMDYGGSYGKLGYHLLPTTYQYGVRLYIDPTREEDSVEGPIVPFGQEARSPVIAPNPQIRFDIRSGTLTLDAPGAALFTGFLSRAGGEIRFANGVELKDVRISVPKEMPYAQGIAEERYIGFGAVSEDGKPLRETKRAMLSLVSTSFNAGFRWLDRTMNGRIEGGDLPVLTARVSATVVVPGSAGMRYALRDWHMQLLGEGTIGPDNMLRLSAEQPVFVVELTRP